MKNFTNNFKQFTSRLSARWLIMTLMLLLGTSSAWAQTWCLAGSFNGWSDAKLSNGKLTVAISSIGEYEFKIKQQGTWDNAYTYSVDGSRMERNNCSDWQLYTNKGNSKFYADVVGNYTFTFNSTSKKLSITYPAQCTSCCGSDIFRVAGSSNLCGSNWDGGDDNNKMECSDDIFSKSYNITGNTSYTFKIVKNNSNWINTINSNASIANKIALKTTGNDNNVTLSENPSSNGKLTIYYDPNKGIYATFEKSCNTLPDDAYSLSTTSTEWTDSDITPTIRKKDNNYPTPTITYNDKSDLPKDAGTYTVVATVSGNATYCDKTFELGTFTITCSQPAEAPSYTASSTTSCDGKDNEIGVITLSNYDSAYTYKLNDKAVTVTNNQIIGLTAGSYKISAAKTCGSAKSDSKSGTSVTISSTDLTPALSKVIEISGDNEICAGESTVLTCNAEALKGRIESYTWNQTGTIDDNTLTTQDLNTTTSYIATVTITNDGCSKDFSSEPYEVTVTPIPSKPSFVTSGEVTCAGQPVNPNLSDELASGEYLVWYDASEGGTILGSNLTSSTKDGAIKYYAAVSNGTCESAERTAYIVDVETDPITDLTLTLVDANGKALPANHVYCQGDDVNVKLTYNGGIYWGEPEWNSTLTAGDMNTSGLRYDAVNKKGEGTYTISNLQASGTLQVALTMCGDEKAPSNVLNVNITPQAETPTVEVLLNIEKCGNDITQYGKIQVTPYNAGYTYKINDTDVTPNNNGIVENLSTAGSFTLFAINSCKVSTPSAPFTISETDNNPTISNITISNSSPVINEDVLLTVEGSDIARVEWSITSGTASLSDAFVNSVKLSSTVSGAVTVTAKAISAYGCETTLTKEVTFIEEEDCTPIISKDIQITFYHPSTYNEYNSQKGQWWGMGTMYYSTDKKSWLTKDMGDATSGSKTVTIQNITSEKLYVYFESKWTYHVSYKASTKEDIEELTRGNRYDIRITSHGNDNEKATSEATYTGSLSTPAPLSAPAVKTVSATSEEGSGVVTFTGKVLKTGCANGSAIWVGYQFKKADEEWPTTGVTAGSGEKQLVTITNNPGSEDFTANVEGLEDGDYHFRAYIINGYNFTNGNYDQGVYYGLDKLVTISTVKAPVTRATIERTDAEGTRVANDKKYCVGETGYIKVTSDVKYTTIQWKTDKGTEIDVNGNNGIYSFVAKGDDNIWVMLSNKHNDIDRPAINENPLVINTFADPILPRVSLNKVSICSNDEVGATVKLTNVVKGQTYQLYQQIENAGGSFTEQAIGEAKTQTEEVTDRTELVLHTLNNTYTTGKYFVKTYTSDCEENIVATQPFTFTVVDAAEVFISIDPARAETTPWMPAKFTVNASDKYTLNVTKGNPAEPATEVEVNQNGNKVSVKIPLPEGSTGGDGQYENVTFPQGAKTSYTITANLATSGGVDNPCAAPAEATITLTPYVEPCTEGH